MSKSIFRKKTIERILSDVASGFGDGEHSDPHLNKELRVRDLTLMGIAAVVGAGIFSTIGEAAYHGGPGVSILFVITAVTCGFSALCYAEFASRIPVAGSAYTYAYASFGELIAWIIGWDLLMEYAIGNIAVAISWSGYFVDLLEGFRIHLPRYVTVDYLTAFNAHKDILQLTASHHLAEITNLMKLDATAWNTAPGFGAFRFIANLPALAIVIAITYLVYVGIRETRKATNAMVILKIAIVIGVIIIGFFYVTPANWHPFMPNGFGGVMKGVSGVFFAYIGFDAISTTAEECENPQRDLPRGMIYSLIICTVLYILISLVLTGMVSYKQLAVPDPMSFVFKTVGLRNISYVISISAVVATASVLLIFQLGQPRIWMSMSRDGLLPKIFSRIHPKYHTPSFATVVTGFVVAVPALFLNLTIVTDLTSIGTLFAFVLVCGGVLLLPRQAHRKGRFHLPYVNAKWIVLPVLFMFGAYGYNREFFHGVISVDSLFFFILIILSILIVASIPLFSKTLKWVLPPLLFVLCNFGLGYYILGAALSGYNIILVFLFIIISNVLTTKNAKWILPILLIACSYGYRNDIQELFSGPNAHENFPLFIFFFLSAALIILSFIKNLSLIPVLGLLSCLYLMTEMGYTNWLRFLIWLVIGLVIYFSYSYKNSVIAKESVVEDGAKI